MPTMIITTDFVKKSGQGVHMFSGRGVSTIQNYNCYSTNQQDARPPWKKPKRRTKLNPERMTLGASREDFARMEQLAATEGLDTGPEEDLDTTLADQIRKFKGKGSGVNVNVNELLRSTAQNKLTKQWEALNLKQ